MCEERFRGQLSCVKRGSGVNYHVSIIMCEEGFRDQLCVKKATGVGYHV